MDDTRTARLFAAAAAGRLNRRQALSLGLRLGLASPVITALMAAAPETGAAPRSPSGSRLPRSQGGGGGTFTVVVEGEFQNFDPHESYDNQSQMLALATYEMLIQLRGESTEEFEPMLAQQWEGNADGSSYTFRLAPGALFHDGSPCDAQAVKDSFTRFLLMDLGPVNVISRFVESPDQMVVVDPTTIRFDLGRPQPLFLPAMASQYGPFVVNPRVIEANKSDEDPFANEWLKTNPVNPGSGTGPFYVEDHARNERTVLTRFERFHGGFQPTNFDQIVMRVVPENATRRQLLEQGDADATTFNLTPDDVAALRDNPDVQVLEYDTTAVAWAIMNAPRLKTVEVRKGFSYAFPYDEVVNAAYRGLIKRSGPLADTVRGHDPNVFLYQTDLAKAKDLILQGGFKEGDKFQYLVVASDEVESTIAQLFQANVNEMGFELELQAVDRTAQGDLVYGDAPAEERPHFVGAWSWWPDYNDPWNQFAPNFLESATGGGGSNGGYWVNQRFEEIMAEAETYTDETRLNELMKEAQNILTEQDPPCIYFGQIRYYTILAKDIQGYYSNPLYLGAYPFYRMSRAAQ